MYPQVTQLETRKHRLDEELAVVALRRAAERARPRRRSAGIVARLRSLIGMQPLPADPCAE